MSAVKQWVFTLHMQEEAPLPDLWNPGEMTFLKFQLEKAPSTGALHLQGVVALKDRKRMAQVKALLGEAAHVEQAKAWKEAVAYAGKEETRVDGPWQWGKLEGMGTRTDLEVLAKKVMAGETMRDIAVSDPVGFCRYGKGLQLLKTTTVKPQPIERRCALFWGTTGTGKTRLAFETFPNLYTVFNLKNPWFDGYGGEKQVLLDECGMDGMMHIDILKRLLDRYPMMVPVKGSAVAWEAETVILTSNMPIEEWYPLARKDDMDALKRRVKIFHFPAEKWLAEAWITGKEGAIKRDRPQAASWGAPVEIDSEESEKDDAMLDLERQITEILSCDED